MDEMLAQQAEAAREILKAGKEANMYAEWIQQS